MMAHLPSSFLLDSKTLTPRASGSSSDHSTRCLIIVFCVASVTDYKLGSLVPTEICRLVVVQHLVLMDSRIVHGFCWDSSEAREVIWDAEAHHFRKSFDSFLQQCRPRLYLPSASIKAP